MDERRDVVVLGIGNVLWADEGFGVRAIEALNAAYEFPAGVMLADGGTLGLGLLGYVTSARRVLVLDAIDFGLLPGTLRVLRDAEVPAWGSTRLSPHQTGFNDVLALAFLHGRTPDALAVIGVQPAELGDFGGSLSPVVKARLPEAVLAAEAMLAGWGFPGAMRTAAPEALNARSLALHTYEKGRPSADEACRIGDPRLLARAGRSA